MSQVVTVVIPTYQREQFIAQAIQSALAQEDAELRVEVIVVDDGSTDGTADVVGSFGGSVRYIKQANRREGAARNVAIAVASGATIAFLDSDDYFLPGKLKRDLAALEMTPSAGMAFSRAVFVDATGAVLRRSPSHPPITDPVIGLQRDNFIPLSTVVVPTAVFNETGVFSESPEMSGSYDWNMWMRIAVRRPIVFSPADGAVMRSHPGNMMSDPFRMERALRAAVRDWTADPVVARRIKSRDTEAWTELLVAQLWAYGGNRSRAHNALRAAVAANPRVLRDSRAWRVAARALLSTSAWGVLRLVKNAARSKRP